MSQPDFAEPPRDGSRHFPDDEADREALILREGAKAAEALGIQPPRDGSSNGGMVDDA